MDDSTGVVKLSPGHYAHVEMKTVGLFVGSLDGWADNERQGVYTV